MLNTRANIYVGFDKKESSEYAVCCKSAQKHMSLHIPIHGLVIDRLRSLGLYTRETEVRENQQLWDVISDAAMSTEFSISRFLVTTLCKSGWALFQDCDMMWRVDPVELFKLADPSKAVMCVKHVHVPTEETKMTGMIQTKYSRKNWSSFMLFNCDHPANKKLTLEMVNSVPGRDLHRFCWLEDDGDEDLIGELPAEWNYLVGITKLPEAVEPKVVHWTLGSPSLRGYEDAEYKEDYFRYLHNWAERAAA